MINTALLNERVVGIEARRKHVATRLGYAKTRVETARERQRDIDAVQATVQYVAAKVQGSVGSFISAVVTKAMHHVFPSKRRDTFVVNFRENRGKTECELAIVDEKGNAAHPFHCSGGGVWDTLSFALVCCCLVLEQPAKSRFLFLDEPFKNLHGMTKRRRALDMMDNTCERMGISAIVVHQADAGEDDDSGLDAIMGDEANAVYLVELEEYELSKVTKLN